MLSAASSFPIVPVCGPAVQWELLTWFAGRSQLLGRQMPALATYYKATAMLLALECPCPHDWSVEQYYDWLKQAAGVKYQVRGSSTITGSSRQWGSSTRCRGSTDRQPGGQRGIVRPQSEWPVAAGSIEPLPRSQ